MNDKSFRIKYTVKCKLQNFFKKEMLVKHCMSEMHAKTKLDSYCKKKYGIEYICILIVSCREEDVLGQFGDIFGKEFGDIMKNKKDNTSNYYDDLLKNLKKKT